MAKEIGTGTSSQIDVNHPVTILAAILMACAGASMFQVEPMFLGAAAVSMGLDDSQIGLLAGIELTGAALGSVAAVFWVPHFDWRKVAAGSLSIIVIGNLLSTTVDQLNHLIAIRFVTGLFGQGTVYAVALAVVSDMRNPDRVFGLTVACQVGITMIAMLFLPGLIDAWGTSGVLVPLAAFALFILPFAFLIPAKVSSNVEVETADESSPAFPVFIALGAQVVWYLGVGAVWAFIERIGSASNLPLDGVGTALAIGMGVGMVGALLASVVGTRWGRLKMYMLAIAAQVIALYTLTDQLSWTAFAIAVTLFNVSWNFALPFLLGAIAAHDVTGRFTVLIIAAQGLGVAIGPIIAGFLSEEMGLASVSYFGIVACIVSIVIFAAMHRIARRMAT